MKACNYVPTEFEAKFKYHGLRRLDIIDLYIITQVYEGKSLSSIAKDLGVYQGAITHRVNRHMQNLGAIYAREKRLIKITEEGEYWAKKFISVFKVFEG